MNSWELSLLSIEVNYCGSSAITFGSRQWSSQHMWAMSEILRCKYLIPFEFLVQQEANEPVSRRLRLARLALCSGEARLQFETHKTKLSMLIKSYAYYVSTYLKDCLWGRKKGNEERKPKESCVASILLLLKIILVCFIAVTRWAELVRFRNGAFAFIAAFKSSTFLQFTSL